MSQGSPISSQLLSSTILIALRAWRDCFRGIGQAVLCAGQGHSSQGIEDAPVQTWGPALRCIEAQDSSTAVDLKMLPSSRKMPYLVGSSTRMVDSRILAAHRPERIGVREHVSVQNQK